MKGSIYDFLRNPRYLASFAALLILLSIAAISGMYPIVLMQRIVDNAVVSADINELLWLSAFYIALQIFRALLNGFVIYVRGIMQGKMSLDLQVAVFHRLRKLSLNNIKNGDPAKISDAVIHDTRNISENLVAVFADIVSALMSFGFGVYFVYHISAFLILIIVPIGFVSSVVINYTKKRSVENITDQRQYSSKLWDAFTEGIMAFLSLRLHGYTAKYIARIERDGADLLVIQKKQIKLEAVTHAVTTAIFMITIGVIMTICSVMVRKGLITFGGLTAVLMYNHMLTDPLIVIQNAVHKASRVRVSLNRLSEACSGAEDTAPRCTLPLKGIAIRHLDYGFDGRTVINDINTDIANPSSVAIYGPTGAGKSTLANIICGIYDTGGKVRYQYANGESNVPPNVSYLLQDEYLFNDSIINNILIGNTCISADRLDRIINICQVKDIIEAHGNTPIGKNGSKLSGGERKRVLLARALADEKAAVYIFDEMSASLDHETFLEIWRCADDFLKDKVRVYIEHNRAIKPLVNTVIELL